MGTGTATLLGGLLASSARLAESAADKALAGSASALAEPSAWARLLDRQSAALDAVNSHVNLTHSALGYLPRAASVPALDQFERLASAASEAVEALAPHGRLISAPSFATFGAAIPEHAIGGQRSVETRLSSIPGALLPPRAILNPEHFAIEYRLRTRNVSPKPGKGRSRWAPTNGSRGAGLLEVAARVEALRPLIPEAEFKWLLAALEAQAVLTLCPQQTVAAHVCNFLDAVVRHLISDREPDLEEWARVVNMTRPHSDRGAIPTFRARVAFALLDFRGEAWSSSAESRAQLGDLVRAWQLLNSDKHNLRASPDDVEQMAAQALSSLVELLAPLGGSLSDQLPMQPPKSTNVAPLS